MRAGREPQTRLSRLQARAALASLAALGLVVLLFHLVTISSAVVAQGQVGAPGAPQPVASPGGGTVRDIAVQDGDTVTAGEILIRLESTPLRTRRDAARDRLADLLARKSRLETEARGGDTVPMPDHPPGLDITAPLAGQRAIFRTRAAVRESRAALLAEQDRQTRAQAAELEARIGAQTEALAGETSETLRAERLAWIAQLRADLAGLRTQARTRALEAAQTERAFHEEVAAELREVAAQAEEQLLDLARIDRALEHLDIRAPVSGVVRDLQAGGVTGEVEPQEPLLTVVPVSDSLRVDVRVPPASVQTLHMGQQARIRFPALDRRSTPELAGTVVHIAAANTHDPATGGTFYRVSIAIDAGELARLDSQSLIPGMPAEAFLPTGDRSVLSFLVKPLTDQFRHAFHER